MPQIKQPEVLKGALGAVVVGIACVGGAVAAWCYFGHHFWTALKGPTEITLADIAKLDDPRQLPSTWVKVKFDKTEKSSVVLEEVSAGTSRVDEEYLIFQAGERWMIANVPADFSGNELSGQIWHRTHGLGKEAIAAITEELKDVHQGKLFPFEFDAGDNYGTNWKCFAGVMAFFAASGVFLSCLGLGGVFRSFREPDPADYGVNAHEGDLSHLDPQTTAAANDAMARFLRDAGR